jgi:hypothetical protein
MKALAHLLCLLVFCTMLNYSASAQDFSLEATLQHLKTLSSDEYQGRGNGMEGGEMARAYLLEAFEDLGLEKVSGNYVHPFKFFHRIKKEKRDGHNLIGLIKGNKFPDQYLVLTAHYDHLGIRKDSIYNGADDNASGTAALLAIASHFTKNPPAHSILIVAFDAEELGLQGAKSFVDEPPFPREQLLLNINMDMIGRNVNNEVYICGTYHYPQLKKPLKKVRRKSPLKVSFGHDKPEDPKQDDWTRSSDHGPFHKEKIPFLYFGVEDHPDYHRPSDDFEAIMPDFYGNVIRLVIQSIEKLDRKLPSPRS